MYFRWWCEGLSAYSSNIQSARESIRLCTSEVLLAEQFVPARLLQGIMPDALVELYHFWQDQDDNLRGYPIDPKAPDQSVVYVTLKRKTSVEGYGLPGVCGEVRRTVGGQHQYLTALQNAAPHTPLANIVTILTRIENLSHVLVWSTPSTAPGVPPGIAAIDLPRLGLSFRERDVKGTRMLFSVDHVNLFVPNFAYGSSQVPCSCMLCFIIVLKYFVIYFIYPTCLMSRSKSCCPAFRTRSFSATTTASCLLWCPTCAPCGRLWARPRSRRTLSWTG